MKVKREEKGPESILLSDSEFSVYNFLRRASSDPLKSPTIEEIAKQTKLKRGQVPAVITSIKDKGIAIQAIKTDETEKNRYFISIDSLEKPISRNATLYRGNMSYSALYLGDPAFGTKAANPEALKGLVTFLEKSGKSEEVQFVLMSGGVVPHVPPYATESYKQAAHFLGKTKRLPGEEITSEERELKKRINSVRPSSYFEEQLYDKDYRKITSLTDAFRESGERVGELMSCLPEDTRFSIQWGEEDHLNKKHIEDALIASWSKENEDRAKKERDGILEDYLSLYSQLATVYVKKEILGKKRQAGESDREFRKRIKQEIKESGIEKIANRVELDFAEGSTLNKDQSKTVREIFEKEFNSRCLKPAAEYIDQSIASEERPKIISTALGKLEDQITSIKNKAPERIKELQQRLEDADRELGWVQTLLGGDRSQITFFTKQYPIKSDAVGAAHRVAKDIYATRYHQWNIAQIPNVHDSHRKTIPIPTLPLIERDGTSSPAKAEIDYSIQRRGDKNVLLIHNIRSNFSNATGSDALRRAKEIINFENMVMKKLYEEVLERDILPDIIIAGSHGAGAFKAQPWFQSSDEIIRGNFSGNEYTPQQKKMSWLVQLPKFQDMQQLQWLRDKGFKNPHIKAMESGPFATAAILHSEDHEGVTEFTVLDTAYLEGLAEINAQINTYKKEIRTITTESKPKIQQEITRLRSELERRINGKRTSIEAAGDFHIGTIDMVNHYTRDQFIKASQSYFMRHGLPDIVSLDETLHGCEDNMFKGGARYEGMNPEEFRVKVIERIMNDTNLTPEEKVKTLAGESMRNLRKIPMHNEEVQLALFDRMVKPYLDKVLSAGGKAIFTSGNHYGHANRNGDEALKLASQFPIEYSDRGKIVTGTALGNPFGYATIILPGKQKLFVKHKFKEQSDEITGMLAELRKANCNCDIVIGGDRHHPGIGYADGHLAVLHPGMEPINGYVHAIGKQSGVRGVNLIEYIPGVKGFASVKGIFDQTLEKIVDSEKIM